MTTCKDVIINNFIKSVNNDSSIMNYKSNILFPVYKQLRLKEYSRDADIQRARVDIDRKYVSGFNLLSSYPTTIPSSALNNITQPFINVGVVSPTKVNINGYNDSSFFAKHIVGVDRKLYTCPQSGGWSDCYFSSSLVDRMCCACGKSSLCNPSTGCYASLGLFEPNGVQRSCNITLEKNIFEASIVREKKEAQESIDRVIQGLRNDYTAALTRMPIIEPVEDVQCCQEIDFGKVEANQVIINSNKQCIV